MADMDLLQFKVSKALEIIYERNETTVDKLQNYKVC